MDLSIQLAVEHCEGHIAVSVTQPRNCIETNQKVLVWHTENFTAEKKKCQTVVYLFN